MDSKLKAKVITIALLMVVMVIGTVFYANYLKDKAAREKKAQKEELQAQAEPEETPASPIEEYASLAEKYHLDPSKDPYAFLDDDSFFDVEEEEKDPKTQLSLLVSSAERDIYVSVVNGDGEAVKGQRFGVSLTKAENTEETEESATAESVAGAAGAKNTGSIADHHKKPDELSDETKEQKPDTEQAETDDSEEKREKEENIRSTAGAAGRETNSKSGGASFDPTRRYVDLDKDGCIYIADIDAGNYKVSLEDVEGFEIAGNDVPVLVKEQLEYTVLKDISYLIRTEDEIDAVKEDTAVNQAEIDADGTEHHQKLSEEDAVLGIDVSKWNKEINWKLVKEDGIQFAIIRCGYRGSSTGALVEDKYFKQNIEGAIQAGIKVGVYFFTQAVNEAEAALGYGFTGGILVHFADADGAGSSFDAGDDLVPHTFGSLGAGNVVVGGSIGVDSAFGSAGHTGVKTDDRNFLLQGFLQQIVEGVLVNRGEADAGGIGVQGGGELLHLLGNIGFGVGSDKVDGDLVGAFAVDLFHFFVGALQNCLPVGRLEALRDDLEVIVIRESGGEAEDHNQGQDESKDLLHLGLPPSNYMHIHPDATFSIICCCASCRWSQRP